MQKSHLVDLFYGFYAGLFCVSTILKIYPAVLPHVVAKIYYIDHGSRFTVLACAQVKDRSDTTQGRNFCWYFVGETTVKLTARKNPKPENLNFISQIWKLTNITPKVNNFFGNELNV